jgi:hypothetical protein
MHLQFRENSLGVMPGGVLADLELARNGLIGPALAQQTSDLSLASGEPKLFHQNVFLDPPVAFRRRHGRGTLLQIPSERTQLVDGAAELFY